MQVKQTKRIQHTCEVRNLRCFLRWLKFVTGERMRKGFKSWRGSDRPENDQDGV